ncbi:hypothetical protein H3Z83_07615 [Tenacibaculum sp. S7007]|uniref:Bacteriocin n=1 Tax=Tenacibaculum pelagium TaxID=2759527 RepID=A0A839AQ83_9FLAO|nr:hypothetical protein [Tenacibaculum pelagium]
MKKSILNLGNALNKAEQKAVNGGFFRCTSSEQCSGRYDCCSQGTCIDTTHAFFQPYCS